MTIPASDIVQVNPGVISAGGNPLALNGLILSQNTIIPTMSAQSFVSSTAVKNFFGAASSEYAISLIYFQGFDNSTIKPGVLHFAPYVLTDRAAWVQSGSLSSLSLAQLQALTGTLIVTVDGTTFTSSAINLTGAASFSAAATTIAAAFTGAGKPTCTWNPINSTFVLTSPTVGATSTIGYCTGTLATSLKFASATGALLSQGDIADTPTTAMDNAKAVTQNWVTFMTLWEPLLAAKQLFADWVQAQNQRYSYVVWDTDAQAIVANSTTCFGAVAKALAYDGIFVVYNTKELAAMTLGTVGSIDFSATNGRITFAFKSQSGFTPTVTDQQIAATLTANGYNFYAQYATSNNTFNWLYNGQTPGKWIWFDSFINQIQLNGAFQLALMTLLGNVKSIPYNEAGYSLIRAAMSSPINAALNFGTIRAGVALSPSAAAQVNQAAGLNIAGILAQQGYYLQVLDPGTIVRGNRGTPVINFWYTDGGAVQRIVVASTDIL